MKIACTDNGTYQTNCKSWTDEVVRHSISYMEIATSKLPENEAEQDKIIAYALSKGLTLNLHAPYGINNISSVDSVRRASSMANVRHTIDLAARHGLGTVTFHPGRLSDDSENAEEGWIRLMNAVSEIAQYAKEKKVYVGLENMELRPYELVYTIEDLNRFAHLCVDNPYFGVTIDFAHYASHGIGLPDLGALKLPIHDVHLSRIVNGKMHSSLVTGDGTPDIDEVIRLLAAYGYDGLVVLELNDTWGSAEVLTSKVRSFESN